MSAVPSGSPMIDAFEREYRRLRRNQSLWGVVGLAIFAAALLSAGNLADAHPARILEGLPRIGDYLAGTRPDLHWATLGADLAAWFHDFPKWLGLLFDTMLIALMATLVGVIGGILLCFTAAHNLTTSRTLYHLSRRLLEFARTVPELVWALIFVVAFGVGAFAGFLALAVHSVGALGKLYAEVNENVDERPLDGLRAAGANWFEVMRFGVFPQVAPGFTAYTLWRVELNLRAAAIVGFVGAGGIGAELHFAISFNNQQDVSALVLMIVATVVLLDLVSERLRHRIIGRENLQ